MSRDGDLEPLREQVLRERVLQIARRLEALVEIARQRLAHDLLELRRDLGVLRGDRRHLGLPHQLDRLVVGLAVEEALAGQQLVQEDADGEDVGAAVDLLAARRLGRQVARTCP